MSFNVLNQEKRLEKERLRQIEIERRKAEREEKARLEIENFGQGIKTNQKWADMSDDEEEEEEEVLPPISDTESEESESEAEPQETGPSAELPEVEKAPTPAKDPVSKAPALKKSEQKKKDMEDLDALLGEFGIDAAAEPQESSSKNKKKRGKKEKLTVASGEAEADRAPMDEQPKAEETGEAEEPKKVLSPAEAKKLFAKKSSGTKGLSTAQAAVAAEKKKEKEKAKKKDKRHYN